jgi:hypothetical protein
MGIALEQQFTPSVERRTGTCCSSPHYSTWELWNKHIFPKTIPELGCNEFLVINHPGHRNKSLGQWVG